jgi:hypothetical protein
MVEAASVGGLVHFVSISELGLASDNRSKSGKGAMAVG